MSEKRREARYPARISVRVLRRGEWVELLTNDVSYRGAFVRTDAPPSLRQLVRVSFAMPDGKVVGAHAMVVHVVDPTGNEKVPGVGFQFWGPVEHQKSWEQFIYDLKVRERAGVPSSRAGDKIRRSSERFKLALDVDLGGSVAVTRDVSETGMAIRTTSEMQVGMRMLLRVNAPGREAIAVDVVVRRRIVEHDFTGLGVEFVDVNDETRAVLLALVRGEAPDGDAVFIDPGDPGLH